MTDDLIVDVGHLEPTPRFGAGTGLCGFCGFTTCFAPDNLILTHLVPCGCVERSPVQWLGGCHRGGFGPGMGPFTGPGPGTGMGPGMGPGHGCSAPALLQTESNGVHARTMAGVATAIKETGCR